LNPKQAEQTAGLLGYTPTTRTMMHKRVFTDGSNYIVVDRTNHLRQAAWKMADSIEALKSKSTRGGTYDINLKQIGD
jgi:hypothetical protein